MNERAFWLAWSQMPRVGAVLIQRLHRHFGSLETAWMASGEALAQVEGFGDRLVEGCLQGRSQMDPKTLLQRHQTTNPHFWTPADPEYPRLLLEIPDPPPLLYYKGRVEELENLGKVPAVALVGTRYPSEYGKRWTYRISTTLAKHGFAIVSGMAKGIDAVAHQGCLDANGRTWAVLGTGLDMMYPPENRALYRLVAQRGLLVSEYPAGTKPDKASFPRRNRIIAGLCRAVLVMEAPLRSGALITARQANEYGRDVYALPGRIEDDASLGCLQLIKDGAGMVLGEEALLEALGTMPYLQPADQLSLFSSEQNAVTATLPLPELSPELQQVFDAISLDSAPMDLIVERSQLSAVQVTVALLELEMMGLVSQLPGMRYRRS